MRQPNPTRRQITGTYPPTVTDINLSDITVATTLTKADVATNVTDLELTDVVIDGVTT